MCQQKLLYKSTIFYYNEIFLEKIHIIFNNLAEASQKLCNLYILHFFYNIFLIIMMLFDQENKKKKYFIIYIITLERYTRISFYTMSRFFPIHYNNNQKKSFFIHKILQKTYNLFFLAVAVCKSICVSIGKGKLFPFVISCKRKFLCRKFFLEKQH